MATTLAKIMPMREKAIGELRNNLSAEIHVVESTGQPTRINNNGKPVAVLVSIQTYESMVERTGKCEN